MPNSEPPLLSPNDNNNKTLITSGYPNDHTTQENNTDIEKAFPTPSKLSSPSSPSLPRISQPCVKQRKTTPSSPLCCCQDDPGRTCLLSSFCTGPGNSAISPLRVVCKVVRYGAPLSLQLDGSNNGSALSLSHPPLPPFAFVYSQSLANDSPAKKKRDQITTSQPWPCRRHFWSAPHRDRRPAQWR